MWILPSFEFVDEADVPVVVSRPALSSSPALGTKMGLNRNETRFPSHTNPLVRYSVGGMVGGFIHQQVRRRQEPGAFLLDYGRALLRIAALLGP
jgi:hypothetical protein